MGGKCVTENRPADISTGFIDNIVAPLAACLGDFLTLFILALIGAALVSLLGTPLVMILVIAISMITFGFGVIVRRQQREERMMTMKLSLGMRSNGEPKEMEQGGWSPLVNTPHMNRQVQKKKRAVDD
jgi:hypothetical protein